MPVITINGPVGSGAMEVGQLVAQQLNLNYVDRLVLAEAAKLVHAPVGALLDKEQRVDRFRGRLAYFLQTVLERSALYADAPGIIHVGMLAPLELRVATIIEREHLTRKEAEAYVEEVEQARTKFFSKFFKVNPNDLTLYHLMLNLGQMRPETAAEVIAHAAKELRVDLQ